LEKHMNMTKSTSAMLLMAVLGLLAPCTSHAAIYYVATNGVDTNPGSQALPFRSIQHGIDFTTSGDTLSVGEGIYHEAIVWNAKSITVRGAGQEKSLINNSFAGGERVTLTNVPASGVMEGFAISPFGMWITGGAPTINECAFSGGNVALLIQASSPTVNDCRVNNAVTGVKLASGGSPTFNRCTILANSFGGMSATGGSATLNNCTFSSNELAGIYNSGCAFALNNCLFYNHGPSAFYNASGNSTFTHCTFHNNGYALNNNGGGIMNVGNSVLWSNGTGIHYTGFDRPSVTYSDVEGGYVGAGNINVDPLFVNSASGNFRLQSSSPCINAGSASVPNLPGTDADGAPRIQSGLPDMGPYESAVGSWFVDGTLGNDANAGSFTAPFQTATRAFNAADNGNSIYIKQGNYGSDHPRITKTLRLFNWGGAGFARIGQP
jgi:Protein of unknown function (DUF1565)